MLKLNLKDLKIEKDYNEHREYCFVILKDINDIMTMKEDIDPILDELAQIESSQITHYFIIDTICNQEVTADQFLSYVNTFLALFFQRITTGEKRKREARLDVPQRLKDVHCSLTMLKKAINYVTLFDNFNIKITLGEYSFYLVDSMKPEKSAPQFVHSVDELQHSGGANNDDN